jgi:glycosyltransferase involved in cell wall biosynthesis
VTVCSSLNETFALFVAEGVAMGHPILRNTSSGWSKQLHDGQNGYKLEDLNIKSLARKIEVLLNKSTTSNKDLQTMSKNSQDIASKYSTNNYFNQLA